jgi:hypothetical protein
MHFVSIHLSHFLTLQQQDPATATATLSADPRSLTSHMVFDTSTDAFLAAPPMDPLFSSPSEIVAVTASNEDQRLLGHSSDLADLLSIPDVSQPSTLLGREISKIEDEMGEDSERSFRDALSMVCFPCCNCALVGFSSRTSLKIATLLVSHTPFFQGLFGPEFYEL